MTVNQLARTLLQTSGYYSVRHSYLTLHCSAFMYGRCHDTVIDSLRKRCYMNWTERRPSSEPIETPFRRTLENICRLLAADLLEGFTTTTVTSVLYDWQMSDWRKLLLSVFSNGASAFMTCKVISQSLL